MDDTPLMRLQYGQKEPSLGKKVVPLSRGNFWQSQPTILFPKRI